MASALEAFVIVMWGFMGMIAAKQHVLQDSTMINRQIPVLQVAPPEPTKINFRVHAFLVILLVLSAEMNH